MAVDHFSSHSSFNENKSSPLGGCRLCFASFPGQSTVRLPNIWKTASTALSVISQGTPPRNTRGEYVGLLWRRGGSCPLHVQYTVGPWGGREGGREGEREREREREQEREFLMSQLLNHIHMGTGPEVEGNLKLMHNAMFPLS